MDRYRIAPARPVCLSAAGPGAHLRRPGGAEIGIFTAERYFSAADAAVIPAAPPAALPDHELPPRQSVPAADAASRSGRTAASSEASWNSRSGLLSGSHHPAAGRQQHKAAAAGAGAVYGSDQGYHHHRGRKAAGGGGGSGQRWTLFGRDCPCAGRKAVAVDAASKPRSPAAAARFSNARLSPPSAVDECLESDIFKSKKHPSDHQDLPARAATAVRVTVTPGSRALPLAATGNAAVFAAAAAPSRSAGAEAPPFAAFKAAAGIDRHRAVTAGGFTFPAAARVLDEPPRVSLEVFRPIDEDSVMLADPPPPAMPFPGRVGLLLPPAVIAVADEEAMSDASSDLFDLESFAASSSYPTTYRGRGSRRNSGDDDLPYGVSAAAEPALSECMYPASEASVVWSVATAEGGGAYDAASVANFSSAASACCVDDLSHVVPESPECEGGGGFTAAMSRSAGQRKGGGGSRFLNSCRCEKAVSVGPTPVRVVRPPAHPGAAGMKNGGDGAARYYHPGRAHVPIRT
ncbi:unnamed protein product [Urochloa decumbens]|uniref:Uncharacterized protein n=1 Tax=Urochloa decumbens TaxID=240449 RepID=A0ABC8Z850_9POAL